MRFLLNVSLVLLTIFSFDSHARLIQIIHTNDLHSYFTGYYTGMGGYARVKTKINQIRDEARAKGIEVIHLDGGDWGEGTSFFHSNKGVDSVRALEMLGVDVATIGNHDHMMGGKILGQQIRAADIKTKFVAANMATTDEMELENVITPYTDLDRAGISIRVIGLTTAEAFFQYTIYPGKILYPAPIGEAQGKLAKKAGKELVIALTHIGLAQDAYLARNSTSIDLIVGGHSHTKLNSIYWKENKLGKFIPIVQAWSHGLAVGSITLDVPENGGSIKVVEYRLHEVRTPLEADPEMSNFVAKSIATRDQSFSFDWNEIIGESRTPLTGYINGRAVYRSSCWGWHFATAVRLAGKAHVGIHIASFEGVYKPAGKITYGDIADSFPHFRKYGDNGWEIATIKMSGWKLRPFMWWIARQGYGVTFSGLGYKKLSDNYDEINDEDIDDKAIYTVAIPAEVVLAIKTSLPGYRGYLQGLRYTGKYYWSEMAEHVKKNTPISCR